MRTFHIGGVASGSFKQPIIKAKQKGIIKYQELRTVQSTEGDYVVLNKNGSVSIRDENGKELESFDWSWALA